MSKPTITDSEIEVYLLQGYSQRYLRRNFSVDKRRLQRANSQLGEYGDKTDEQEQNDDGFITVRRSILTTDEGEKARWEVEQRAVEDTQEKLEGAVQGMMDEVPKVKPTTSPLTYNENLMNVIPFGDPHFGMYAWAEETRDDDFDLTKAKDDLCMAMDYLVQQAPVADRCVVANVGDFFHAPNYSGTTPHHGNILDMSGRFPEIVRVGMSALRYVIDSALQRHKTVDIINSIGNHDEPLVSPLNIMLSHLYENEPRVNVHDEPTWRHYIKFGQTLIGSTHGDKTKDADLPLIMATEVPELWGSTKHRYMIRGHHHHDRRIEYGGCIVEQVRTLAPSDGFHAARGYLSGRDMKAITFHSDGGEVARSICSIDMLRN